MTYRAYVPVDGETHAMKLGIEYPSGSGKFTYDAGSFEAIEPPPVGGIVEKLKALTQAMPPLPDANTFFVQPGAVPAMPPAK